MDKWDLKLPMALRSVFGGFIGDHLVVCGGIKSNYNPLVIIGPVLLI